jgi:hypothetical protein
MSLKKVVRMAVLERAPGSCPANDFGISSTEPSDFTARGPFSLYGFITNNSFLIMVER